MPQWSQYLIVAIAIAAAAAYLVFRAVKRARRNSASCGGECGCSSAAPAMGTRRELIQLGTPNAKEDADA